MSDSSPSRHDLAEAAQVALGQDTVHAVTVYPHQTVDDPVLELTLLTDGRVPPPIAKALACRGIGIDIAHSGTKSDHTTVVAY